MNNQSKVVKSSFTGSNITKYSGLNTVAKYMNRQDIVKSISTLTMGKEKQKVQTAELN